MTFNYVVYISQVRIVWRYQRGNHNPYIEEEQKTRWPNEKVQKDKQRSTKHTHKTKDRVIIVLCQNLRKTTNWDRKCSKNVCSKLRCKIWDSYNLDFQLHGLVYCILQPLEEIIGNFPYTLDVPGMIIKNIYNEKQNYYTFGIFSNSDKKYNRNRGRAIRYTYHTCTSQLIFMVCNMHFNKKWVEGISLFLLSINPILVKLCSHSII
jgi:hypothetical protein